MAIQESHPTSLGNLPDHCVQDIVTRIGLDVPYFPSRDLFPGLEGVHLARHNATQPSCCMRCLWLKPIYPCQGMDYLLGKVGHETPALLLRPHELNNLTS